MMRSLAEQTWMAFVSNRLVLTARLINTRSCSSKAFPASGADQISVNTSKSFAETQKISRAMEVYLKRASENEQMLAKHSAEYELGKRYLANMMSTDVDNFSERDVEEAIEYLLPSGLYAKRARPLMKPPDFVFPQRKLAEFDKFGRPYHYLFYTGKPNYYGLMHTVGEKYLKLGPPAIKGTSQNHKQYLDSSQWLTKDSLCGHILEPIDEQEYTRFINLISKLAAHPESYKEKDFILTYRTAIGGGSKLVNLPDIQTDEVTGRQFVQCTGYRKTAIAKLKVYENGSGLVSINDRGLDYFPGMHEREQILSPIAFVDKIGCIDIEGSVEGSGIASQAGAMRHAVSLGVAAFEGTEVQEKMRQVGLLTKDPRKRERKKPGQRGAREKKTWKKR